MSEHFLAEVDTGAISLVWAMAELARKPKVMKKAQEEIRNCGGKKKVTESNIDQLEYLKMAVQETLRLYPPSALLLPRETMSPFNVHVNVRTIGRDPKVWSNPEEFIPERFIDSAIDFKGQNYELLPFGAGRRGCPGIFMGMSKWELALANLLLCFDWKLPDGEEEDLNME
uniref:Cytochrome P450 n=1 Tax=Salix viminalis TaxID=40686 RepID=A0A6N2MBD8_SALVM